MLILWKGYQRDRSKGWAHTFLTQMEEVLGTCVDRGIKVVTNAGGLNPAGLADQVRALADRLGTRRVGGPRRGRRPPPPDRRARPAAGIRWPTSTPASPWPRPPATVISANAYLGGWPIVEALSRRGRRGHLPPGHRRLAGRRARQPGTTAGRRPTGTGWPARWWPATSSSADPRRPGATTPSSQRSPASSTRASRSPRWPRTARR